MPVFVMKPVRILHVLAPKCGSTSLFQLIMRMSGIDDEYDDPRRPARTPENSEKMLQAGFVVERLQGQTLRDIMDRYPGYRIVANIRDPYRRLLSNYFDKIKRYTRKYDRPTFYYGKFRQYMEGPASWRNNHRSMVHMQSRLGFEDFVDGLLEHGIDFDGHFWPQSRWLCLPEVEYDAFFRLENYRQDLLAGLRKLDVSEDFIEKLGVPPKKNSSQYNRNSDTFLTPTVKSKIHELYEKDFETLDYCR